MQALEDQRDVVFVRGAMPAPSVTLPDHWDAGIDTYTKTRIEESAILSHLGIPPSTAKEMCAAPDSDSESECEGEDDLDEIMLEMWPQVRTVECA